MHATLLLALLLPSASSAAPDHITFKPREGLALRRQFERSEVLETQSTGDGSGSLSGIDATSRLTVLDRIAAVDDGQVHSFERTYEQIERVAHGWHENRFGSDSTDQVSSCALVGAKVEFIRDGEGHRIWSENAQEADLADLRVDLDLTALLPEGEVELDQRWKLDPDTFHPLIHFMDGLPLEEGAQIGGGPSAREIESSTEHEGEVVMTYRGTRRVDGALLAEVSITADLETVRVLDLRQPQGEGGVRTEALEHRLIEGELLWDVEHGHLASLELEIEEESEVSRDMTLVFEGRAHHTTSDLETVGSVNLRVRFERVEGK